MNENTQVQPICVLPPRPWLPCCKLLALIYIEDKIFSALYIKINKKYFGPKIGEAQLNRVVCTSPGTACYRVYKMDFLFSIKFFIYLKIGDQTLTTHLRCLNYFESIYNNDGIYEIVVYILKTYFPEDFEVKAEENLPSSVDGTLKQ